MPSLWVLDIWYRVYRVQSYWISVYAQTKDKTLMLRRNLWEPFISDTIFGALNKSIITLISLSRSIKQPSIIAPTASSSSSSRENRTRIVVGLCFEKEIKAKPKFLKKDPSCIYWLDYNYGILFYCLYSQETFIKHKYFVKCRSTKTQFPSGTVSTFTEMRWELVTKLYLNFLINSHLPP